MNENSIKISLAELKELLKGNLGERIELYLFGSVARDEYDTESDIDVLVLYPGEVDTRLKTRVIDYAFDIGLKNDVVFNVITRSQKIWESERSAVTPFFRNIKREALRI